MMRLIDADALHVKTDHYKQYVLYTAIEDAQTIDSVPVVRCKDCKYWHVGLCRQNTWCSRLNGIEVIEEDFCSYGERKDGDSNG